MIAIGKHMVAQPTNDGWLVGTAVVGAAERGLLHDGVAQ